MITSIEINKVNKTFLSNLEKFLTKNAKIVNYHDIYRKIKTGQPIDQKEKTALEYFFNLKVTSSSISYYFDNFYYEVYRDDLTFIENQFGKIYYSDTEVYIDLPNYKYNSNNSNEKLSMEEELKLFQKFENQMSSDTYDIEVMNDITGK